MEKSIFIKLNGKSFQTDFSDTDSLKKDLMKDFSEDKKQKTVWIIDGFQTDENVKLYDEMNVHFITKGDFPSQDVLESMMAARHTPKVHQKLKSARVAIAGLGGLGSNIAVMLARIGVGHLHLVDFDVVEPSNLNRQQYFISHLGMKKTDALKNLLSQINPYIEIVTDCVKVTEENCTSLFKNESIICEAFDKPEAKAMICETVLSETPEKILISASGMAGFGDSNSIQTKKMRENFYICGDLVNSAKIGNGLMAPRVTICAAHQANLVVELIVNKE